MNRTLRQTLHRGQLWLQGLGGMALLGWLGLLGILTHHGQLSGFAFQLLSITSAVIGIGVIAIHAAVHHRVIRRNTVGWEWLTAQLGALTAAAVERNAATASDAAAPKQRVLSQLRAVTAPAGATTTPPYELRAVLELFQQCDRLLNEHTTREALGDQAAQVAHDLRGPITFLRTLFRHLRAQITDAQLQYGITTAETTLGKLHQMADDLCDVAKAQHPQRAEVDLAQLAQSVLQEVRGRVPAHIHLTYEGPTHGTAPVDALKLNRVLTNLLDNAVQAIPASQSGAVTLSLTCEHKELILEVRDTGCGIAPEQQVRLFEKFFTTKGAKGNGLGLAYCKDVIEAHGGAMRVESVVGMGSTFTIMLPQAPSSDRVCTAGTEVGGKALIHGIPA